MSDVLQELENNSNEDLIKKKVEIILNIIKDDISNIDQHVCENAIFTTNNGDLISKDLWKVLIQPPDNIDIIENKIKQIFNIEISENLAFITFSTECLIKINNTPTKKEDNIDIMSTCDIMMLKNIDNEWKIFQYYKSLPRNKNAPEICLDSEQIKKSVKIMEIKKKKLTKINMKDEELKNIILNSTK